MSIVELGGRLRAIAAFIIFGGAVAIGFFSDFRDKLGVHGEHADPSPFFDGLESYQSFNEAKVILRVRDDSEWTHTSKGLSAVSERRGPLLIDLAELKAYVHLGISGRLVLKFINDRLAEVSFVPDETEPYLRQLQQSVRSTIEFNKTLHLTQNTRFMARRERSKPVSVIWFDERLREEERNWMARSLAEFD